MRTAKRESCFTLAITSTANLGAWTCLMILVWQSYFAVSRFPQITDTLQSARLDERDNALQSPLFVFRVQSLRGFRDDERDLLPQVRGMAQDELV
jgi:hypothetical protein